MKKEHYVFGLFLLLFILLFGYESYVFTGYGHHASMHGGKLGPSMMGFNWTFWIFLIFLLVFAYLLIKGGGERAVENSAAIEILEKRYARGEITRDEYLKIFKDLLLDCTSEHLKHLLSEFYIFIRMTIAFFLPVSFIMIEPFSLSFMKKGYI